ncbi:MmgE/PrpD family protein, partial [Chloroflexota bacterium]
MTESDSSVSELKDIFKGGMMEQISMVGNEEAALLFARHVTGISYKDLPAEVVDITKKCILDTVGVTLAASGTSPEAKVLVELVKEAGGTEESTILGFGGKVPSWHAGYLNGAMSHCLDYDDLYVAGGGHISAPIVPSAIAMAERCGSVNGKELITAVASGIDMFCRLGLATVGRKLEWMVMPIFGVFGAAAACGKLLSLDEEQQLNAFGIAFTR